MTAQPITNGELDRAIYDTQPSTAIVLVPRLRGRSNPVQTPNIIYMPARAGKLPAKRQSGDVIVVTEHGSNLVFAENEDALASAIPHSSLEPVPEPYVLTTPVLPIDEKPMGFAPATRTGHLLALGLSLPSGTLKVYGDSNAWIEARFRLEAMVANGEMDGIVRLETKSYNTSNLCGIVTLSPIKGGYTEAARRVRDWLHSFKPTDWSQPSTKPIDETWLMKPDTYRSPDGRYPSTDDTERTVIDNDGSRYTR